MTATEGPRKLRFDAALNRLREEVRHGPYATRGMLPGERDLATLLSVSRTTVRRILGLLIDEGLLMHRQGVGTFVARAPTAAPQDAVTHSTVENEPVAWPSHKSVPVAGFTSSVRHSGREPSSREVVRELVRPTPHEAMLLGCLPDEPATRLSRLRCVDGDPVASERAVLPRWALPEDVVVELSLYEALGRHGIVPVRALQRVRVASATAEDHRRLGSTGAVAQLQRTDYLADGRCCLFTRTVVRADCFDLLLDLRSGVQSLGILAPNA